MTIVVSHFAIPRPARDTKNGDVLIVEREERWYAGIRVEVAGEARILLLRFLAGERPPRLSFPSWPPVRDFSCYVLPGEYVVRPQNALAPFTGDGSPPVGSIAITQAGRAFLRHDDGGQVAYVDLMTGAFVGQDTGEGERIFYDAWELVRRVEDAETVIVSYPDHKIRPLPKVSGFSPGDPPG
jgi:hypothetical protein